MIIFHGSHSVSGRIKLEFLFGKRISYRIYVSTFCQIILNFAIEILNEWPVFIFIFLFAKKYAAIAIFIKLPTYQ